MRLDTGKTGIISPIISFQKPLDEKGILWHSGCPQNLPCEKGVSAPGGSFSLVLAGASRPLLCYRIVTNWGTLFFSEMKIELLFFFILLKRLHTNYK